MQDALLTLLASFQSLECFGTTFSSEVNMSYYLTTESMTHGRYSPFFAFAGGVVPFSFSSWKYKISNNEFSLQVVWRLAKICILKEIDSWCKNKKQTLWWTRHCGKCWKYKDEYVVVRLCILGALNTHNCFLIVRRCHELAWSIACVRELGHEAVAQYNFTHYSHHTMVMTR